MYPWELEKFIEERNYCLGGDDLRRAISFEENPQLVRVLYSDFMHKFYMWDKEGHTYEFGFIPYEEAKQKGLVKKRNNLNLQDR